MDARTINQTVEILPIVGDLKKSGAYFVGPCPMCGGRDRFTVKHTPGGDRWHCRRCGDGKWHGVIDLIMARDHVPFIDAARLLAGGDLAPLQRSTTPAQPTASPIELPDVTTQAAMLAAMDSASDDLLAPTGTGLQAQEYLYSRGITPGTWYAWHIGAAMTYDTTTKTTRPAIWFPWYYVDAQHENITAIKYRFIDELAQQKEHRFNAKGGGKYHVPYGLWDAQESHRNLIIVEGEINALSLWQCGPHNTTVLSIGSQGGARVDVLAAIARRYQTIFIWCDDPDQTNKYKKGIARPARGLRSPEIDGVKMDANKLLQLNQLTDFINKVIGVDCQ